MGDADRWQPRRSKRIHAELVAHWTTPDGSRKCVISEINAHGFFIRTSEPPELGSMVRLDIELRDRSQSFNAVVRFVGRYKGNMGFGGELVQLDTAEERCWRDYYEQLLSRLDRLMRGG